MEQSTRFKQVPNPTGVKCSRKFHGWICPGEALEPREEELFSRECLERENKGRMKGQQAGVRLVQQHQGRELNSGVETAKERRMEHSQMTGRGKQHFEEIGLITEMVNGRGSSKRKKIFNFTGTMLSHPLGFCKKANCDISNHFKPCSNTDTISTKAIQI